EGMDQWELEIFGFEDGPTLINFNGSFKWPSSYFSGLIAQEVALYPLLAYFLGRKGYYLLHAGGVSKNGSASIFNGRGGSHKTVIIKDLVARGYEYLGDDWIILQGDEVLPFPVNFEEFLFSMRTNLMPTESSSSLMEKVRYLRFMRKGDDLRQGFHVSKPSRLRDLFLISKTNRPGIVARKTQDPEISKRMIANNQADFIFSPSLFGKQYGHFLAYTQAYSYIFPANGFSTFWESFGKYLETLPRKGLNIWELEFREKYSTEALDRIFELMGDKQ
ncbi:MAG: hypothetical protein LUP94_00495, partial [Candidatus Methanomethylicus sp.]|nr:hypothetical protein [Candidatus Methanomethylicus sp.]